MRHWKWVFNQLLFYCRRIPEGVDGLGFGSLTIWNMRTWKTMVSALNSLTNISWKGMNPCNFLIMYPSGLCHHHQHAWDWVSLLTMVYRVYFLLERTLQWWLLCASTTMGRFWLAEQQMAWFVSLVSLYTTLSSLVECLNGYWVWKQERRDDSDVATAVDYDVAVSLFLCVIQNWTSREWGFLKATACLLSKVNTLNRRRRQAN